VSRVREDLGYPPLVTPTSQIVGTQAVMNVLAGERYKIVPNEVKDYVRGLYGRSPVPVHRRFIRKILGDEQPISGRPADRIAPMLPKATDGVDPKLIHGEEDILSYVLLPEPAVEYFKYRALPPEQRPETPADLEIKKAKMEPKLPQVAVTVSTQAPFASSPLAAKLEAIIGGSQGIVSEMLEKVEGLTIEEILLRKGDQRIGIRPSGAAISTVGAPVPAAAPPEPVPPAAAAPAPAPAPPAAAPATAAPEPAHYKRTIIAPLVGKFYSSPGTGKTPFVKEGDTVNAGDKVCIVEAMKLFNEITAPVTCRIIKVLEKDGAAVQKGQPLIAIEEV
jgi:oxaloacetate decarboxylase alpha subunit